MKSGLRKDQVAREYIGRVQNNLRLAVEPVASIHHQVACENTGPVRLIAQAKTSEIQRRYDAAMTALEQLARSL